MAIDGHDVREVTLASLRRQFGIVLQDTFLFSMTIGENIRYGRLDATDAEIEAAARAVGVHDFIASLPAGYATKVGERGSGLSVGQRQLIAFARVMLADPRIVILDEATSSVDTRTERIIQEALRRILQGRTSLVIAHRLSTIIEADLIVGDRRRADRRAGAPRRTCWRGAGPTIASIPPPNCARRRPCRSKCRVASGNAPMRQDHSYLLSTALEMCYYARTTDSNSESRWCLR